MEKKKNGKKKFFFQLYFIVKKYFKAFVYKCSMNPSRTFRSSDGNETVGTTLEFLNDFRGIFKVFSCLFLAICQLSLACT